MTQTQWEPLSPGLRLCVSRAHKFGADAFLLSSFAAPRSKDIACDLGSGCGIVPALWFRDAQSAPACVYAVELQKQAVAQMRRSVAEGGLPASRFIPVQADLRTLPLPKGGFTLVTCNPPYQAAGKGVVSADAAARVARHETQCTLGEICAVASWLLRPGGRMCLCQRPQRLADAVCAMRANGLEPKRLRFVQQRPKRAPWLFLLEGRRAGKPFLRVDAPLLMEGEAGCSDELQQIYGMDYLDSL